MYFQMDVLDIVVSNEELQQFQVNETKLWIDGNCCEGETCKKLVPFSTFRKYISYWSILKILIS